MPRTTTAARDLLRKHAPDPLGELLEDVQAALAEAQTTVERRAISAAAAKALDAKGLAGDDAAVAALAQLTDPQAAPEPARVQVLDDQHRNVGRTVSAEEWAAEDQEFAQVLNAVRNASSSAEAYENLTGAMSLNWDPTSLDLMQLMLTEVAENDDGSAAEFAEARKTEEGLRVYREAVAAQEAATAQARRDEVFREAWAAKVAEAEAAQSEGAESDAA
jgi:hypothetical protein